MFLSITSYTIVSAITAISPDNDCLVLVDLGLSVLEHPTKKYGKKISRDISFLIMVNYTLNTSAFPLLDSSNLPFS